MKALLLVPFLLAPLAAAEAKAPSILDAARAKGAAVAKARAAFVESGRPSSEFKADCAKDIAGVTARLAKEKSPEARRDLLVARLYYRRLSREIPSAQELAETRKEVPAIDPAWSLDANLLPSLAGWDAAAFGPYLAEARAGHPDGALRRSLLLTHFFDMIDTSTESEWRPSYSMLMKDFPDSPEAQKAKARLESEARTAVGAQAPPFSLASLEDATVTFTPASFAGKYVLVDFWASWCPDCVGEMPNLHKAWARFKGRGLEVLSLSLDRKAEHVAKYRAAEASTMPWKHAFLEGGWKNPVVVGWGVMSIPKPVLVGPDGRIVAAGADLRGENLERTLGKFLEP
jgi:thiol-disulfide isomerase/thioredoxin